MVKNFICLNLPLFYCDEIACLFIVNIDSKTLQVEKLAYKVILKFYWMLFWNEIKYKLQNLF